MIVGTAGHIDHGKTALVKALTGVDADRLPEEKARGITIDLGYAYTPLPDGEVLGFIDVPGHEKLVRNMLAGATGIDYVLLVVAADDGPMPQTREHLQILELLGLSHGAVALTKIDRVSPARVVQSEAEVRALLSGTALAGSPVFRLSSVTGEGVAALKGFLESEAARLAPRPSAGHFRLAIDRCFTLPGAGTVVTGTVFSGAVSVGDALVLSPPGLKVRVRSLHAQNQPAEHGTAGQRCALNLVGEGFDKSKVQRGYWVLAPPIHAPSQRIDVQLNVLAAEDQPLVHWTPVHFHLAAVEAMGRVALLEGARLNPGETGLAEIVLDRPIGALRGDRFVIRDQSALRSVGGGMVLDPFPPSRGRRAPARLELLRSCATAQPAKALEVALQHSRLGVDLERFALNWNLTEPEIALLPTGEYHLVHEAGGRRIFSRTTWSALQNMACKALADEHARTPDMAGVGRERLCRLAFPGLARAAYDELITGLLETGQIAQTGAWLHTPEHHVQLTAGDLGLWQKVEPLLEQHAFHPPRVRDLSQVLHTDENTMRQLLIRVARIGKVYPVAHDHYFTQRTVMRLAQIACDTAAEHGSVNAADFRDRIGTGRKLAIQILEFFDHIGFTRRAGDRHLLRQPDLFSAQSRAAEPSC